ncbi:hypothetical protein [Pedococcus sp. 5OH_020]|uniref:hypothetical protein n=1 Tax=Pedococcus sp. 5OH_020 TaxID=2989814 RepID=UPI0022E9E99C|nr:hypothetical protein [Pedococcus sp. 5OH_020]
MHGSGGVRGLKVTVMLGGLLLGLTGCSGLSSLSGAPVPSASAPASRTASARVSGPAPEAKTSAPAAGTASGAKPSAPLPAGYRWRTVAKAHTRFATPDTFTALDASKLSDATADSPQMKEMAARSGFTAQQLTQYLAHVDLFLAGPAVGGYAPNIQAVVLPVIELPSDAAITLDIGRVATSKPTVRHVRTSLGDAVDVTYRLEVSGRTVHVRSLLLGSADGVLNVTIAAPDQATASTIARTVLRTARRA